MREQILGFAVAALALTATDVQAQTQAVRVDIIYNGPTNGVAITPVWAGFHDGSFDSYDGGLSSQTGLENLAEDGNNQTIDDDFLGGYTYVDVDPATGARTSDRVLTSQTSGRVSSLGIGSDNGTPPPIQPGETASQIFTLSTDGSNDYFSYASMILPSNDFYIANGNPTAHGIESILDSGTGFLEFEIGLANTINDAGTEENDFAFAAPGGPNLNGLFPGRGFGLGQPGPNEGVTTVGGVNANVLSADPFSLFASADGVDLSGLNFNDTSIYGNGIATIRITAVSAVPEPSGVLLLTAGLSGLGMIRRRRK